jgi:hypothetical protein
MTESQLLLAIFTAAVAGGLGFVSKVVFDWVKGKNGNGNGLRGVDMRDVARTVYSMDEHMRTLMDIQCRTDADGVPMVYMPREYRSIMKEVAHNSRETNWYLKQLVEKLEQLNRSVEQSGYGRGVWHGKDV